MRSKTSAALLLLLSFLLGAVTGGVSGYLYQNHVAAAGPRGGPRSMSPDRIVHDISTDLGLDSGQQARLKVIITQSRERYKQLSVQFRPQYQAIRDETSEQIRQILRDDQKARFEQILKEKRRSRRSTP